MILKKVQLENFRSYKTHIFEFDNKKEITLIVGQNGKGKTNFLEAIYVLSFGKSFRISNNEDLIKWKEPYTRCKCILFDDMRDDEIELEVFSAVSPSKQKNYKKNGVNLIRRAYIGSFLTVLFHPEDMNILSLSPQHRRRYMNILLSQISSHYLSALSNYKQVIKQKNKLLYTIREQRFKGNSTKVLELDLQSWNDQIIEYGTQVYRARFNLVEFLNQKLGEIYREISSGDEVIKVIYKNSLEKKTGIDEVKQDFTEKLKERMESEIRLSKSKVGPHLDDLIFFINDKEITLSASRGEMRTLMLAIKICEIKYIEIVAMQKPVLLLDDVFSELDEDRQKYLLKAIDGYQSVITTTEAEPVLNSCDSSKIQLAKM